MKPIRFRTYEQQNQQSELAQFRYEDRIFVDTLAHNLTCLLLIHLIELHIAKL